jgi:hypothetical protein
MTIHKEDSCQLNGGELKITVSGGDAHVTSIRIYQNGEIVANGEGEIFTIRSVKSNDLIEVKTKVYKDLNSGSQYASTMVKLKDGGAEKSLNYTEHLPDESVVKYSIKINLT